MSAHGPQLPPERSNEKDRPAAESDSDDTVYFRWSSALATMDGPTFSQSVCVDQKVFHVLVEDYGCLPVRGMPSVDQ
jgi:hypothetical protein